MGKGVGVPFYQEYMFQCYVKMKNKIVYSFIKRLFDIVASLCGTIVLIPVTIIVGLAIKIEDGGPIFFCLGETY